VPDPWGRNHQTPSSKHQRNSNVQAPKWRPLRPGVFALNAKFAPASSSQIKAFPSKSKRLKPNQSESCEDVPAGQTGPDPARMWSKPGFWPGLAGFVRVRIKAEFGIRSLELRSIRRVSSGAILRTSSGRLQAPNRAFWREFCFRTAPDNV
jgi:hypothetical protein